MPPHEATHRTARVVPEAVGTGIATVRKIRKAPGLALHRWRSFELSTDQGFAAKLTDIVGLHVGVVISIEDKTGSHGFTYSTELGRTCR